MPNVANDLLKKLGGGRVGQVQFRKTFPPGTSSPENNWKSYEIPEKLALRLGRNPAST